jgi:crossover junction endodeoxyribonuclease RuvC
MSVLAIDLGGTGATAEMSETGDIVAVHDNPVTKEANGRSATNAALWAPILARSHARVAFIEWIAARPTDAKVAAFAFGRCRGLAEGICGSLSIPIVWLTPPVWKRLADIPPGAENKDMARTRAIVGDELEEAFRTGAVIALRRRAARQRKIAADWTVTGERGVRIVAGEGRIAERIAEALEQAAKELEREEAL